MSGKIIVIVLALAAVIAGASLYYLQVYAFYREIAASGPGDVELVRLAGGSASIAHDGFRAIDADSSPIRYRACFVTDQDPDALAQDYVTLPKATPRNAPGWFDCFDARSLGEALDSGQARAFLSAKNIHFGVDRIVAITRDGHGFVWHELNECGEKAYDGTVIGEDCPPRPAAQAESN